MMMTWCVPGWGSVKSLPVTALPACFSILAHVTPLLGADLRLSIWSYTWSLGMSSNFEVQKTISARPTKRAREASRRCRTAGCWGGLPRPPRSTMAPRMKFHGTGRGASGNLSYRGANEDEYPVGHGNVRG